MKLSLDSHFSLDCNGEKSRAVTTAAAVCEYSLRLGERARITAEAKALNIDL